MIVVLLVFLASSSCATIESPTYIGPLVCSDISCPSEIPGGPVINNTNFHLRDISVALAGDGFYYITGTSTSAGDQYWSDVYGVIRMWRSPSLAPGSFEPGGVTAYNITRDCPSCSVTCRTPNTPSACPNGTCARVWAPEFHFIPEKAKDVPGSGGYFMTFHFHCSGGFSGVMASTTGTAFGPYTIINSGVSGGDVTLFRDPSDGSVYTASSGSRIAASLLSQNMTTVLSTFQLGAVCEVECSHSMIGFEGTQLLYANASYFMCASAYGNQTNHGGPQWPILKNETADSNIYYSTWCGRADTLAGPFVDVTGDPGGWLSVPFGGHNTYFLDSVGSIFSTLWYGSSARDLPPACVPFVDLPSIVSVEVVGGRLQAIAAAQCSIGYRGASEAS